MPRRPFPPGELVGTGRSAHVFEYGEREVLRRYSLFLSLFLRHFDRAQIEGQLGATGAYRLRDRSLPDTERKALERLIAERV